MIKDMKSIETKLINVVDVVDIRAYYPNRFIGDYDFMVVHKIPV